MEDVAEKAVEKDVPGERKVPPEELGTEGVEEKMAPEEVDDGGASVRGLNRKLVLGGLGGLGVAFFLFLGVQMLSGTEEDEPEGEEYTAEFRERPRGEGDIGRLVEEAQQKRGDEEQPSADELLLESEAGNGDAELLREAYEEEEDDVDEHDPWEQAQERAQQQRARAWYQDRFEAKRGDVFARVSDPRGMDDVERGEEDELDALAREARQLSATQRQLSEEMLAGGETSNPGGVGGSQGMRVEEVRRGTGRRGNPGGENRGREQYTGYGEWEGVSDAPLREAPRYAVQAGTMLRLVLQTGVNSDLPGLVQGRVRAPVYDTVTGRHLLIPSGSTVIGEYQSDLGYGDDRVGIAWQRLILPNGKSIQLGGVPGTDAGGHGGVADEVDRRTGRIVGAAAVSSMISTGSGVAAGPRSQFETTPGQAALGAFGGEAAGHGESMVDRELDVSPTVEIRPGMRMGAMVREDLILEPYEGS